MDINEALNHIGNFLSNNSYVDVIRKVGMEFLSSGSLPILTTDPVSLGVSVAIKALGGLVKLHTTHEELQKQLDDFKFRSCHLLANFAELTHKYSEINCPTDPLGQYLTKFCMVVEDAEKKVQEIAERTALGSYVFSPFDTKTLLGFHEEFNQLLFDLNNLMTSRTFFVINQLPENISQMLKESRKSLDRSLVYMIKQIDEQTKKMDEQSELIINQTNKIDKLMEFSERMDSHFSKITQAKDRANTDYSQLLNDQNGSHYMSIVKFLEMNLKLRDQDFDENNFVFDENDLELITYDDSKKSGTYKYGNVYVNAVFPEDEKKAVAACVAKRFEGNSFINSVYAWGYIDGEVAYLTECFVETLKERLESDRILKERLKRNEPLEERLIGNKTSPLSLVSKLSILKDIAKAICVIHGQGYLHRNICPQNVSIRENWTIALCGFENSRDLARDGLNSLKQTNRYAPPEFWEKEVGVHPGMDSWSFGVLFFELMTGYGPFYGKNDDVVENMFMKHIHHGKELPLPFEKPFCNTWIQYYIFECPMIRCFSKEMNDRPTFSEIINIIESLETAMDASCNFTFRKDIE
eukprot:TRINITY_DN3039_c0_g2_i2.p1 TRINITY_DN3039_c0_g2~~TRINITY_DN3039_c0_g2_i2.p1  ORF type:complete len:580 (+),score=136.57 TRINITY_DN3039_c0_g2_i2:2315-4054(+)